MSTENRFAVLFSDEEEEVPVAVKEVAKPTRPNEKRVGNVRPGKREFDRQSGTGRGHEIPKNGSGNRNWGNPKDVKEQLVAETVELSATPVTPVEGEAPAAEIIEEPKPVVFTLEEYEAQQKEKLSKLMAPKTARKVEEVEAEKVVKVEEDYFVAEGVKGKKERKEKEAKEEEIILNFQAVDGEKLDERRERRPERSFEHRERRPEGRPEGERRPHERREGRPEGERRPYERRNQDRTPKINLKSEKAFPKL